MKPSTAGVRVSCLWDEGSLSAKILAVGRFTPSSFRFPPPLKIHVVVTPAKKPLDEAGAIDAMLAALGKDAPARPSADQLIILDISDPDTSDLRAELARLGRELANDFAQASSDGAQLKLELGSPAAATESSTAPVGIASSVASEKSRWTPEAEKLHDLNGSRANAALPRVLSTLGDSARRRAGSTGVRRIAGTVGNGAQEAVVRVAVSGGGRNLALAWDEDTRFRRHDAGRGTLIAVAECLRALACRGASALVTGAEITFPNPCRCDDLRAVDETLKAVASARAFFSLPGTMAVASAGATRGGKDHPPRSVVWAIGGSDADRPATGLRVRGVGERLIFLGEAPMELGGSQYLRAVHGLTVGDVPALDLSAEKKLQSVLLTLIRAGIVSAAASVAAGGVMAAVCEMLFADGRTFGAKLDLTPLGGARADALLFGESQGRVIIAVAPERVGTVLSEAHMRGVSAALIGEVTAEPTLGLKTRSLETQWAVAELRKCRDEAVADTPANSTPGA